MSGLVGYANSDSGDEDPSPETETVKIDHLEETATTNDNDEGNLSSVPVGPVLGPVVPNGQSTEGSPDATENLSDRDAIRFLTQAPFPMTSMPPSPPGSPDPAANAKFARFRELKAKGVHFNLDLASKSGFLNPGLLPTLMARAGIPERDQYNSTLPPELWNPQGLPAWAHKEALLESQKAVREGQETEKKALSAAGKRKIDFATAGSEPGSTSKASTPQHGKRRRP